MIVRNLSKKAAMSRKVKTELGVSFSVRDVQKAIAGLTAPRVNRIR